MEDSDNREILHKFLLVGVIGVNSIAGFSMAIAHTSPSNADVFYAIVILCRQYRWNVNADDFRKSEGNVKHKNMLFLSVSADYITFPLSQYDL